jgi:metallo-beta-lactamase family protein
VKIYGKEYSLKAQVKILNGFSAHADQSGLIKFANGVRSNGEVQEIFLVHGEDKAQKILMEKLNEDGFTKVMIPKSGDRVSKLVTINY